VLFADVKASMDLAEQLGAELQGALARTVLADALIRAGEPEAQVAPVLAEARALVERSGGNALLRRLREAEAMYHAVGALDPAERLAWELDSLPGTSRPSTG